MRRDPSLWIAVAVFIAHVLTAGRYGIFRDELYYLACADHLAWGYVDHPPLSIAFLALWKGIFGDGVLALRVPPAVLHALATYGSAMLAGRMGAGAVGRAITAACVGLAGGFLGGSSFYSMNSFELAFWVGLALLFERILHEGGRRWWLSFGVVFGLAMLNKYSVGVLGLGLLVGLLASPARREILTPWPWVAAAIAAVLFAPHVAWQVANDWPTREFVANAQAMKITRLSPGEFMLQSWLEMLPPTIVVWLPGLAALLFWSRLKAWRAFGLAWVVAWIVFNVQVSKPYYLNVAYPLIFAGGGAVWTMVATRRWVKGLAVYVLVSTLAFGAFFSPFALPVLRPERFVAFAEFTGVEIGNAENSEAAALPQHLADRFGWEEMATTVAGVYDALPPDEKSRCAIVGRNYGQAGALRYFGDELGLPPAVSQHNSFWSWGPGGEDFDVYIVVGRSRDDLEGVFESVVEAARHDHRWAMPYERDLSIWVCRGMQMPLAEVWARERMFI